VENAGYGATWAGPIATLLMEKYLNDSISAETQPTLDRVAKADLIPAAIKHWYYVKDSIKQAKLAREMDVNTQPILVPVSPVPKKTTFDPETEPNRKDTSDIISPKASMILPNNDKNKPDSTPKSEK
jgi:penicillin-binding protein 2